MTAPISPEVMGRPLKEIDPEKVRALASIHCTLEEIGAVLGCSVDTLERRFADIIEKGKLEGKSSLRRKQWEAASGRDAKYDDKGNVVMPAKEPNITMLIWLGKQMLGQKDQLQLEAAGKDGSALAAADTQEYDYSQLSVDELTMLEELSRKALRRGAAIGPGPVAVVEENGSQNGTANGTNGDGPHDG
jgi:hypothetical protein